MFRGYASFRIPGFFGNPLVVAGNQRAATGAVTLTGEPAARPFTTRPDFSNPAGTSGSESTFVQIRKLHKSCQSAVKKQFSKYYVRGS